jgi:aminodeoxyfutalosine synthase
VLREITKKLDRGERLTLEDGIRLFEHPDLLEVASLANRERERRHGDLT